MYFYTGIEGYKIFFQEKCSTGKISANYGILLKSLLYPWKLFEKASSVFENIVENIYRIWKVQ